MKMASNITKRKKDLKTFGLYLKDVFNEEF